MRICRISVTKLFGMFDHDVPLNLTERTTIIHGPNGVGKTALLRLIDGVFNRQSEELLSIPFEELRIGFDDESILVIKKHVNSSKAKRVETEESTFDFLWNRRGVKKQTSQSNLRFDYRDFGFPLSLIDGTIPGLRRIGPTAWISETGEKMDLEKIVSKFGHLLPINPKYIKLSWPEWLDECVGNIPVRFVRAQRLLLLAKDTEESKHGFFGEEERRPRVLEAVLSYSTQLRDLIQQKLAESSILSQSLDRTFPQRLMDNYGKEEVMSTEELFERLIKIEKKRNFLINVGLYDPDKETIEIPEVDDQHIRRVLSVYVKDIEQKLGIFDDLAAKINLLVQLVNSRFKYKQIEISKEKGFVFRTNSGLLSPANLSSGEQHELVLTYELLFKTQKDTLVLIDEPELSLHVGWQIRFLEDLQQIINLAQINTLVATHSPQIINNRWDLTVKLGGGWHD